jgi:hypothetical protein
MDTHTSETQNGAEKAGETTAIAPAEPSEKEKAWVDLAKELGCDPFVSRGFLQNGCWRVFLQARAAERARAAGFWESPEAFAAFLTDWAIADDAWARWPQDDAQWLTKHGADPMAAPAATLMVGGARFGRIDWIEAGWRKAQEADASRRAAAAQQGRGQEQAQGQGLGAAEAPAEGQRLMGAGEDDLGNPPGKLWSLAHETPAAARASEASPMPSGWRWRREGRAVGRERRGLALMSWEGRGCSNPTASEAQKTWSAWLDERGVEGPERLAHEAMCAAARHGQVRALEWMLAGPVPLAGNETAWSMALAEAGREHRPRALAFMAGLLDPAPEQEPSERALDERAAAGAADGLPAWACALRELAAHGGPDQLEHLLALWRKGPGGRWSLPAQAKWLDAGEDMLARLAVRLPFAPAPRMAMALLGAGFKWSDSLAVERALESWRAPAGSGWGVDASGVRRIQALGLSIAGIEGLAAHSAVKCGSVAAFEWAMRQGLDFNKPAELGPCKGESAAGFVARMLDNKRRPRSMRQGEAPRLARAAAHAEAQAIAASVQAAAPGGEPLAAPGSAAPVSSPSSASSATPSRAAGRRL